MKADRLSSMKMKWLSLLICAVILSACSTPYQPMSAFGGYREIQLAPDIYRVMFFGNGYTNGQTATEYAIHRCAELTQQRGYRYFGILADTDMSTTRTFTIPAQAYTTGNLSVNSFGNTAFGTYNGSTFITPARTIQYNFPRPVLTIKMFNKWSKDASLVDASTILSVQMPGVASMSIQPGPTYSGPHIALDERTKARIVSFVQRFVAAADSGSTLPPPLSFYGPDVLWNGRPATHEFLEAQLATAARIFPQRSFQIVSGPVVSPSQDSPGATVNYDILGIVSNGRLGLKVNGAVQLTVQKRGEQFEISAIWPRVTKRESL
jgi:hypothetical protein